MGDAHREKAICEAIDIMTGARIARASFDKTIKGIIKKVTDKAIGEYQVKYQDSVFPAYATSSDIVYKQGQEVDILIPGNDWDRKKTIIRGTDASATNYKEIKPSHQLYNTVGQNGFGSNSTKQWGLRSGYKSSSSTSNTSRHSIVIFNKNGSVTNGVPTLSITENDQAKLRGYVQQADGIGLKMTVQTKLAPKQQGPGSYRMVVTANIRNEAGKVNSVDFILNENRADGNPYKLTQPTVLQTFYSNINTKGFIEITKVVIQCFGFNAIGTQAPIDILISDLSINGGTLLTQDELAGYTLYIDYSKNGKVITDSRKSVELQAQLKVKGVVIQKGVEYYWFIKNGSITRGDEKFFAKAGEGWQSLNVFDHLMTPFSESTYIVQSSDNLSGQRAYFTKTKTTTFLCVAVYNNGYFKKEIDIIDQTKPNIQIYNFDRKDSFNRTVYYFGVGNPHLQCKVYEKDNSGKDIEVTDLTNYTFIWSIQNPINNDFEQIQVLNGTFEKDRQDFISIENKIRDRMNKMNSQNSKRAYYDKAIYMQNHDKTLTSEQKDTLKRIVLNQLNSNIVNKANVERLKQRFYNGTFIYKNEYYNYPINTIINSVTISCAVKKKVDDGQRYEGTASITLYNKLETQGQYSLILNGGNQVFQYDGKGNSPCGPAVQKPIKIEPLTFTLLDNNNTEISFDAIKEEGRIWWLFPKEDTLLISKQGAYKDPSLIIGTDEALAAGFNVYENLQSFSFAIADEYDAKKTNNYIRLNVQYKQLIFDAYTNFSFPKDGDPGTNGTDFYAKIVPSSETQRIYISSLSPKEMFGDNNQKIQKLNFRLYNGSRLESPVPDYWICPPALGSGTEESISSDKLTLLAPSLIKDSEQKEKKHWENPILDSINSSRWNINWIRTNKPINIIRSQKYNGKNKDSQIYYAEQPICTEFITDHSGEPIDNSNYPFAKRIFRLKVKQKTGFNYVVYSEDGVRPNYDSSSPFQIIIQEYLQNQKVWIERTLGYPKDSNDITVTVTWYLVGNLEFDTVKNNKDPQIDLNISKDDTSRTSIYELDDNGKEKRNPEKTLDSSSPKRYNTKAYIKPKNTFNGQDLSSAIIVNVNQIGFIHIPVYMILNRYNHSAINGWDGNSIQLNDDAGIILAPQVGAGSKDNNNKFSGVLLGAVEDKNTKKISTGFFGYNHGQRSIFLDADTGNAYFGKNTQSRINIGADKVGIAPKGSIYSGNYYTYDNNGIPNELNNKGMLIDLTTPQIRFGSGDFYVTKQGNLYAKGKGQIAGWNITDYTLYKDGSNSSVGMNSNPSNKAHDGVANHDTALQTNNGNMAFWAGVGKGTKKNFFVTHDGYLFSKSGQIAGWDIDDRSIAKVPSDNTRSVGMNSYNTQSKLNDPNMYGVVLDETADKTIDETKDTVHYLAFWAGNGGGIPSKKAGKNKKGDNITTITNANVNKNFFVTHDGYLRAKYGKIANWHLLNNALTDHQVGMGNTVSFGKGKDSEGNDNKYPFDYGSISAIFWGASQEITEVDDNYGVKVKSGYNVDSLNFAVDHNGNLYSKAGRIAGWKIQKDSLSAKNIVVSSTGEIYTTDYYTKDENGNVIPSTEASGWSISSDGTANFNNIQASIGGKIGGWTIGQNELFSGAVHLYSSGQSASKQYVGPTEGYDFASKIVVGNLQLLGNGSVKGSDWYINSKTDHNLEFNGVSLSKDGMSSYKENYNGENLGSEIGSYGGGEDRTGGYLNPNIPTGDATSLENYIYNLITDRLQMAFESYMSMVRGQELHIGTASSATITGREITFSGGGGKLDISKNGVQISGSLKSVASGQSGVGYTGTVYFGDEKGTGGTLVFTNGILTGGKKGEDGVGNDISTTNITVDGASDKTIEPGGAIRGTK